jgi:type IV secretion system protein VirB8
MSARSAEGDLTAYFEEASGWDRDRLADTQRSMRRAWVVASAAGLCALGASLALVLLLPLKRVEPYVIRVDATTGVVDVVPVYRGTASLPETVTRYLLANYVRVCERFNYATAESDYQECGAFQTPQGNQAWYALWNPSNPNSPLNLHRDGSIVAVQIESVSFLQPGNRTELAQIRYRKVEQNADGEPRQVTHWIATVQYGYQPPSADARLRAWNPLGFRILHFTTEPEVLNEAPASAPAAAGSRP